jgi:dynein heavy chain
MKKTPSLSSSLALSSLKGTIPGFNDTKGGNQGFTEQYKWDLSSTAVSRKSPVKSFNEKRLQRQEWQDVIERAEKVEEKNQSSGIYVPPALEPKVYIPHETRGGVTPRRVAVERKKQHYSLVNVGEELMRNGVTNVSVEKGNDTTGNNRLPIYLFDNSEYDMFTKEEWLARGTAPGAEEANIPARTVREAKGSSEQEWVQCTVLGLVPESGFDGFFFVQIADSCIKEKRHRLQICFDAEDPRIFARRVRAAQTAAKNAEMMIRYNLYVDCMPTDDVGSLNSEQVRRVVESAISSGKLKGADLDTSLLVSEVSTDYSRTMNKIIFDANVAASQGGGSGGSGAAMSMASSLQLPPAPHIPPPPEQGCVDAGYDDFKRKFSALAFATFLTKPEVITALSIVQEECEKITKTRIFNVSIKRSLDIDEFVNSQTAINKMVARQVNDDWTHSITSTLRNSLQSCGKGHFNIYESKTDVYKFTKLKKLLTRINFGMQSSLRKLTLGSLESYTKFILEASVGIPSIKSFRDISIDFTNGKKMSKSKKKTFNKMMKLRRPPPLFNITVDATDEPIVLNQDEIDETAAAIKAWKPPADDKKAKCNIQPIQPIYANVFKLSSAPEAFTKVVLNAFDKAIKTLSEVEQVEKMLMDRLFWSFSPVLQNVRPDDPHVLKMREQIENSVNKVSLTPLKKVLELINYQDFRKSPFVAFLNKDVEAIVDTVSGENLEDLDVKSVQKLIAKHKKEYKKMASDLPSEPLNIGLFAVNFGSIRSRLLEKHKSVISMCHTLIAKFNSKVGNGVSAKFEEIRRNLTKTPNTVEEVSALNEYMGSVKTEIGALKESMMKVYEGCDALDAEGVQDVEQFNLRWRVTGWPKKIMAQMVATDALQREKKKTYASEMDDQQVVYEQTLVGLEQEVGQFQGYTDIGRVNMVAQHVKSLNDKITAAEEQARVFNSREALFERELTEYTKIKDIRKSFEPYRNLWLTVSEWLIQYEEWMDGPFSDIYAENLEDVVSRFKANIAKAFKSFEKAGNRACMDIAKQIKDSIVAFEPKVPLVIAIRNPGMRERHWEQISDLVGKPILVDENFTLKTAFDLNIEQHEAAVCKIGGGAGKEFQIEEKLDDMEEEWKSIDLDMFSYRDTGTYVLKGFDELIAVLDEQITMTQAMQFSAFKAVFEERIDNWNTKLNTVSDVLEEWMKLQRSWMYLQPIFDSDDIMKQLPQEGKRFNTVDKHWRKTTGDAKKNPNALNFCTNPKLLVTFSEGNKFLDLVTKGLKDYLETKRTVFTRFYFLSDDELLSILSETKDVTLVQPHLKKCFEGINRVVFGDNNIIETLVSREKEKMPLFEPIDPNGKQVEFWMVELEDMMKMSVRATLKDSIADYMEQKRPDWMQRWPGMCVINGSQLYWTINMENSLAEKGAAGVQFELDRQNEQLKDITILVRKPNLSKNERTAIGALTVMDVHAKDVTVKMVDQKVDNKNDFLWLSQMRFYWEEDSQRFWEPKGVNDNMWTQMVAARKAYGYEYLGNSFRLVITPLTDKCYLTLMGALQMLRGGAPAGPAGTGKTETVKDLAKALAKQCVVFNCGDGLDYKAMAKFFKGLASCGAWACFDEFNRINIEVLSVVAQQIITLQLGARMNMEEIEFEGSTIRLDPAFAPYITMNPGYAGRTELPENLAACFRPVAMMVPDYALIGEIMLYAFGFEHARTCGQKMVTTFTLCSEQLSLQKHYDYGMRAVKTVIVAAGNLKKANPEANELQLLLRALQDVNLPKFMAQDLPLFRGIMSDLFPGIEKPNIDYGALMKAIKGSCEELDLQPHQFFLKKNIQLYETIVVRHGLMTVGPTGGGKSATMACLSSALTKLKGAGIKGQNYEKVHHYKLNAKAITMDQLYGFFDPNTREFIDGQLPSLYRACTEDFSPDRKFIIFDGPVDAIWIENMNTVLDDNKKLCLFSGEMIAMSDEMSMIFETEDLDVASPATVSRVGVVYMEPLSLGLSPLFESWFDKLPEIITEESRSLLNNLVQIYCEPGMQYVKRYLTEPLVTVNNNISQSWMRIMNTFFSVFNVPEGAEPIPQAQIDMLPKNIEKLFFYAFVWSVGATCDTDSRVMFDSWLRSLMETNGHEGFPSGSLVYDFVLNEATGKWEQWLDNAGENANFHYNSDVTFAELVVPTKDAIRNTYLIDRLVRNNYNVMAVGPTGTGKTLTIEEYLKKGMEPKYIPLMTAFSAQTSAFQCMTFLDSKMEKRKKGVYGPSAGKRFVVFIDDFNMPKVEEYGAQPPLEMIRQAIGLGGWYDAETLVWKSVIDCVYVTSMGNPTGGRNPITARMKRLMSIVSFAEMDDSSQRQIFSNILGQFLKPFDPSIGRITDNIINATQSLYNTISDGLLPTPIRPHYTFNLRDMAKVIQGCLMTTPKVCEDKKNFVTLWVHECFRVFRDRMINMEDANWVTEQCMELVSSELGLDKSDCLDESGRLFFGDYMIPGAEPKLYDIVSDTEKLTGTIVEYLNDYNAESKSPMNLVLFLDAIEHVSRIARVLRQPRGNALLLGVGGSGRQSLTRLASYVSEYTTFQVEIAKGYGIPEWREDIKTCLLKAGVEAKPTTFLFSDVQIIDEQMVEDINSILNAGDIPGIYSNEDLDAINTACRMECQKKRIPPTKINIFGEYLNRVRANVHVVFCMSPVGDEFRLRLLMFPSLVNCCTIDWFMPWPDEALRSVATDKMTVKDFGLGDSLPNIVELFRLIHQQVEIESIDFFEKLRRRNWTTPTSYLELLSTYISLLESRRKSVNQAKTRYSIGVDKISTTKVQVAAMQKQLTDLQPVLAKTQTEVDEMMVVISADRESAGKTKVIVEAQAAAAGEKEIECKTIAEDAQRDLDEALPALDAAVKCLKSLKKSDIDEIKAMGVNAPAGVKLTAETCCIMFKVKPVKVKDPNGGPKKINDYFTPAKLHLFKDAKKFIATLMEFDKDNIPDDVIHKIEPYIVRPDFTPDAVAKASVACRAICMWVRAMHKYHHVARAVEPKRQKLLAAQQELEATMVILNQAQAELKGVMDKLERLENEYNAAVAKKDQLAKEVEQCTIRLDSAMKLIGGLGGEETRWRASVARLENDFKNLDGDLLIAAGTIAYLGPFTGEYRSKLVNLWIGKIAELNIPHTPGCTLASTLSEPTVVRQWNIWGLPTDSMSTENGIIVDVAKRWPLCIDPQNQANRYIKSMGKEAAENGMEAVKLTDKNFLRSLENGVRFGRWVLLENIFETLAASLEPILQRNVFKQGGQPMMKLGDNNVPYNESFRFFITTKLPNPQYSPETCVKVTLLNFAITPTGLEDQILGVTMQMELPEVQEKKEMLTVNNARMKAQLKEIEDKILYLLENCEGNILDDQEIIVTLDDASKTGAEIKIKMAEAAVTEKEIDEQRQNYRPVAFHAATLYFCLNSMSIIDPMYQYSLQWYTNLFRATCEDAEQGESLAERIELLKNGFTALLYDQVCRSLFEAHKLLFSFVMSISILQSVGKIDPAQWRFLIAGQATGDPIDLAQPGARWITSQVWSSLCTVSVLPMAEGFVQDVNDNLESWKAYFDSATPHRFKLPGKWNDCLGQFQKILILKCFRPDKVSEAIQDYIVEEIGPSYIEPPPFDLPLSYKAATVISPLIFVLSIGVDPMKTFLEFAATMKMSKKLSCLSLGQGQGPAATRMVENATERGEWVLLQNCHLYTSWMVNLEQICEEIDPDKVHKDFRLWLTSMPSASFPVSVLQNGVKMTNEPPNGLRANLNQNYFKLDDEALECTTKPDAFRKLFFGLCFFHAILIERKRYGALGWNIPYAFNETDLDICTSQLKLYLDKYEEIPYSVLDLLTQSINYGGRITDDKDLRTIDIIMRTYYTPKLFEPGYKFSESGNYYSFDFDPEDVHASYLGYIKSLPINPEPEAFGMHENANITSAENEVIERFKTIVTMQSSAGGSGAGKSREELIGDAAKVIEDGLPLLFDEEATQMKFPVTYLESMNTLLCQEQIKFNKLLRVLKRTLYQVQRALKGLDVMSTELDGVATAIFNQWIPKVSSVIYTFFSLYII